ncbi:MAG: hypothetical protein U0441_38820, partial [Polyangiaceae bacterium]
MCVVPAVVAAACGGGDTSTSAGGSTTTGTGGNTTTTSTGATGGGGSLVGGGSPGCVSNNDCNGGVCVNGVCCASAELGCAGACCDSGQVCLFDKCVVPGKPCHTANDCSPGQYCETALGDNGAGGGGGSGGAGGSGGTCIAPVPLEGKCLDLPPKCDENGQPAGCIPACEYHPPAGQLDATVRWDWGTNAVFKPSAIDVWSTPTVGRVYDGNCDGKIDQLDPPVIVFVSAESLTAAGVG